MGTKTVVWIFQATNKGNLTQEDLDMAKKGKPKERNCISSNSRAQNNAIKLCQSKNRQTLHNS